MNDTNTTPLVLSTAGPFTPEYVKAVAVHADECIRVINHATLFGPALPPAIVDAVLASLATMARRLTQAFDQLGEGLSMQDSAGQIDVTAGQWAGHPEAALNQVSARLSEAWQAARQMHEELNAAHQVTACMAAPYDPSEDPDA